MIIMNQGDIMSVEGMSDTVEPGKVENVLYVVCTRCKYNDPNRWHNVCHECNRYYPVASDYDDLYEPEISYGTQKLLNKPGILIKK